MCDTEKYHMPAKKVQFIDKLFGEVLEIFCKSLGKKIKKYFTLKVINIIIFVIKRN